jgi:hypothetical protein
MGSKIMGGGKKREAVRAALLAHPCEHRSKCPQHCRGGKQEDAKRAQSFVAKKLHGTASAWRARAATNANVTELTEQQVRRDTIERHQCEPDE